MKRIFLPFILALTVPLFSQAQNFSSIAYLNADKEETSKDSATTYIVFTKKENLWHGKTFNAKTEKMLYEGDYAEMKCTTPMGSFNNYNSDGILDNVAVYDSGKIVERTYYYKDGKKRSHIVYGNNTTQEKGWDENGNEIPNYIVERQARFKGGLQGWSRYLSKHLNASVPVETGAPAGDYVTEVTFLVNKEGYVSEVKAIQVPAKCKPCAAESVRVIMEGPNWEPAIQNNEPVVYRQKQTITYRVVEAKNRRG